MEPTKTHESTKAAKEMVEKCDEAETIESQAQSFGVMADDPVIYGRSPSLPPDAPPPEPAAAPSGPGAASSALNLTTDPRFGRAGTVSASLAELALAAAAAA